MSLLCNAPFCENPKKHKKSAYCGKHEWERKKFKVKVYKELLPLWAVKRCKKHGLLKPTQSLKRKHGLSCKFCVKRSSYKPSESYNKIRQNKFLQKRYAINNEIYEEILLSQNNLCAICKSTNLNFDPRTKKNRRMAVDHDHLTGKVRGILCYKCNMGLGNFKDSIENLLSAIKYLSGNKPPK